MHPLARQVGSTLAFLLVLAACGKDSVGNDGEGRFNGTLSHAASIAYSGRAFFELSPSQNEVNFQIFGLGENDSIEFHFRALGGAGTPPVGTYQIGVDLDDFSSTLHTDGTFYYDGVSGTVTITSASAAIVAGSFNVVYSDGAGGTATFVGTFSAKFCPTCA